MRTGSASVPEVGRAAAKEAEPACGGPSRYSMVSVPSRHGSGLDVVLSNERFVVHSCPSAITVLPVIYELKSRRDNAILVPWCALPRSSPVSIDPTGSMATTD